MRGRFNNYMRGNTRNKYCHSKQWRSQSMEQKIANIDTYGCKMNPMNISGNIIMCSICQSMYHCSKKCPYWVEVSDENQEKVNLFSEGVYNCYINKFVGETLNHAVLDSGCSKTVCGVSWLNNYFDTLSVNDRIKIVDIKSDTKFKFGDCKTAEKIPVRISNMEGDILRDVIDNKLPLLLSKEAMKKADTKIDFAIKLFIF